MNCVLEECEINMQDLIEEKMFGNTTNYTPLHCGVNGCHQIYWKGERGEFCKKCEKEVCEDCAYNAYINSKRMGKSECDHTYRY